VPQTAKTTKMNGVTADSLLFNEMEFLQYTEFVCSSIIIIGDMCSKQVIYSMTRNLRMKPGLAAKAVMKRAMVHPHFHPFHDIIFGFFG